MKQILIILLCLIGASCTEENSVEIDFFVTKGNIEWNTLNVTASSLDNIQYLEAALYYTDGEGIQQLQTATVTAGRKSSISETIQFKFFRNQTYTEVTCFVIARDSKGEEITDKFYTDRW